MYVMDVYPFEEVNLLELESATLKKIAKLELEIQQLESKLVITQEKLKTSKEERDKLEEKALLELLKKCKVGHKDLILLLKTQKNSAEPENTPPERQEQFPKEQQQEQGGNQE